MYYPLSKITPELYTSGNEFQKKGTGQDYKGYYFSTYDGKFFTEKTPLPVSVELLKYNSSSSKSTSLAAIGYKGSAPSTSNTTHYLPTPTAEDYTKGYIFRYFIQRVNGDVSTVRELSKDDYTAMLKDPLYNRVTFTWRISGELFDRPLPNGMKLPGVAGFNYATVQLASKTLPDIAGYLTNPSQFYK